MKDFTDIRPVLLKDANEQDPLVQEPSLYDIVLAYYSEHFSPSKAKTLTDQYFIDWNLRRK